MLQATPAELGWMACQNVSKQGKHSEENSMLSLWILVLKVLTLMGVFSVSWMYID